MLLQTCYYITLHILPPQTAINTLWSECTLLLQHVVVHKAVWLWNSLHSVFWAIVSSLWFDNMDELSPYISRSVKVVGLPLHLFSRRTEWLEFGKKHSDMNICLPHLCLLTSLPYWSFQDISRLARRVQCQSAFDHFTLSSTRVLNSSQPTEHFEAYKFSADFWPRC